MRRFLSLPLVVLLPLLLFAECSRAPEEVGAASQALASPPLKARLIGLREIVRGGALEPRLSPDGEWVAFSGHRYQGIRVAPAAGGGEIVELTGDPAAGFKLAWAPDAARIAYVARQEDGSSLLRVVSRAGGEPETLHVAGRAEPLPLPRFAPDGTLVYVAGDRLRAQGRPEPITAALPAPRQAAFTRADELVLAGDQGVFTASADGSGATALFEGRQFFDVAASPDGGAVLLVRELRQEPGLWSLDRRTGRKVFLDGFDRGCILPSGLVVAEKLETLDGRTWSKGELWLLRPDGSGAVKLEGVPGVPYRVDCAARVDRIALGEAGSDSVFVADVEVSP